MHAIHCQIFLFLTKQCYSKDISFNGDRTVSPFSTYRYLFCKEIIFLDFIHFGFQLDKVDNSALRTPFSAEPSTTILISLCKMPLNLVVVKICPFTVAE